MNQNKNSYILSQSVNYTRRFECWLYYNNYRIWTFAVQHKIDNNVKPVFGTRRQATGKLIKA